MTIDNWGVLDTGYTKPTYADALQVVQSNLKMLYGQDIDLSSWSFFGQLAQMLTRLILIGYSEGEGVYDSRYVHTASGVSLDNLAYARQMTRNQATYATGYAVFARATPAPQTYTIPAGTTITTADRSLTYETTGISAIEIGDTASPSVPIRSARPSRDYNLPAGSITALTTPILGVDTVHNPTDISGGSDVETDASFRARIRTYQAAARGTLSALESALLGIDGVVSLNLREDTSNNTVSAYISGGDDSEITAAIEITRPAGILVQWARPTPVTINITAVVTGSAAEINSAVTDYLDNIGVGVDIGYGTIIAVIMAAADGATISALTISTATQTAETLGSAITIADNEQATPGSITITTS